MKKETLKEVGRGLLNFANGVGALSIVNGLFGAHSSVGGAMIFIITTYIFIGSYFAGIILIDKG